MEDSRASWQRLRETYLGRLAQAGLRATLKRAWATLADGRRVVLPAVVESEQNPGTWWLGFDEQRIRQPEVAGAILLCRSRAGELYDFGLPVELLREIAPHAALRAGGKHRQFNVVRRGDRFELLLKAGERRDITARRGDLSWLLAARERPLPAAAEAAPSAYGEAVRAAAPEPAATDPQARFFACFDQGVLRPLDPAGLEEGSTYLVVASPAPAVPRVGALRRLLAAARPAGLPADLSEAHDRHVYEPGPR